MEEGIRLPKYVITYRIPQGLFSCNYNDEITLGMESLKFLRLSVLAHAGVSMDKIEIVSITPYDDTSEPNTRD